MTIVLGACHGDERRTIGAQIRARGPVLVLGDSITVGARDFGNLEASLRDDGWQPAVIAEESKTVPWGIEQVEVLEAVSPTVVVALGSNPSPIVREFAAEITALMDALIARGATRVLWVPPHHADPERYAERAAALEAAAAAEPRLTVLAWADELDQNPHWFSGDGLHLSGEGYAALTSFLVEALGSAG